MSFFTKRYHEPGTPPGTLSVAGEPAVGEVRASLCLSDAKGFSQRELQPGEAWGAVPGAGGVAWLHLQGPLNMAVMNRLEAEYGLHKLALEDVLNTGQRAKFDLYDDKLFMVLIMPVLEGDALKLQQISLFYWDNQVVSFCDSTVDPFASVRDRLHRIPAKLAKHGAAYLVYLMIDMVVDQSFPVLESYSRRLEDLEEQVLAQADDATLKELHVIKRELIQLRRTLWPQREMLGELSRGAVDTLSEDTRVYLRDCYDHSLQIMDMLETSREMLLNMHDLYLSSISNRMNEVMRTLTVIATIFIPLTFIAGIYGMNFETGPDRPWSMPELSWRYGYLISIGMMVAVAVGMIAFFRRKKWL